MTRQCTRRIDAQSMHPILNQIAANMKRNKIIIKITLKSGETWNAQCVSYKFDQNKNKLVMIVAQLKGTTKKVFSGMVIGVEEIKSTIELKKPDGF